MRILRIAEHRIIESAPLDKTQSRWATSLKFVAVVVFLVLLFTLGIRVAVALWMTQAWALILVASLLGYLCVDFVSGMAHWFCDTFYDVDSAFIGPTLIAPFRDHHTNPKAISSYGFLEQDGANYIIILPFLVFSWWVEGPVASSWGSLFGHSFLFAFGLGAVNVNLFHKWAHADKVPPGVRWLQSMNLILSPEHHGLHHAQDFSKGYCVTSGWMNRILDPIRFFSALEQATRGVGSVMKLLGQRFQLVLRIRN